MQRMIDICKILQKYCTDDFCPFWAGHDIIGFLVDYKKISPEDFEALEELSCYYDSDYNSLVIYV